VARNDENPRRANLTAKELRSYANQLSKASGRLKGFAEAMDEEGTESIEVLGKLMMERALKSVKSLVSNCEKAL
jgi:DNA-binding FrmR family transcriptional regulator